MNEPPRRAWVDSVRRLVVKVGSRALVDSHNRIDESEVANLVGQIAALRATGLQVLLVSSGAIAAGLPDLALTRRPRDLPSLQAAAALGQARLIELYRQLFARHSLAIGQVLLTHADVRERERHLNARNTLARLLGAGAVPVINENDTVAVDEIRFGDNDRLAAMVGSIIQADLVVLLTGVDGFYTAPPEKGGELIPVIDVISQDVRAMAGGVGSTVAVGGMRTKLDAAEIVMRAGGRMVIANSRTPDVLPRLLAGEPLGTVFEAGSRRLAGRQRWIAFFQHPKGALVIDSGAVGAVRDSNRSLLPAGIRDVQGDFDRADPVRILDQAGVEIARGLVNYGAEEMRRIAGKKSSQIAEILGDCEYEEAVHRDNLVVA